MGPPEAWRINPNEAMSLMSSFLDYGFNKHNFLCLSLLGKSESLSSFCEFVWINVIRTS